MKSQISMGPSISLLQVTGNWFLLLNIFKIFITKKSVFPELIAIKYFFISLEINRFKDVELLSIACARENVVKLGNVYFWLMEGLDSNKLMLMNI